MAKLRDRRCQHTVAAIATALDGRYRPEHVRELGSSLTLWEKYQESIGALDTVLATQLRTMRRQTALPELAPKPRGRCVPRRKEG